MKQTFDAEPRPERHEWDGVTLVIGADLQNDLDKKLIAAGDLKETIWSPEAAGEVFVEKATGARLASMIKPAVTYWVEYRVTGAQTYEVLSAYYHRMRFQQGA